MLISICCPNIDSFSFYQTILNHPIIKLYNQLIDAYKQSVSDLSDFKSSYQNLYFDLKAAMLEYAFAKDENTHYAKNPWQDFIISQMISDENSLTLLFERSIITEEHPYYRSMLKEIEILCDLYHFEWNQFLEATHLDNNNFFSSSIFFPIPPFEEITYAMTTQNTTAVFNSLNRYIHDNGLEIYENNLYFNYNPSIKKMIPIKNYQCKEIDHLIGYDIQKEELITNTSSLIRDFTGSNVLLQGAAGTGKTTMIKSLLNRFKNSILRMIEINVNEIEYIPEIVKIIENRPYAFIIFIDDLSFDENSSDFKALTHCLETSLNDEPKNIRIYATSDKRRIVTDFHGINENESDYMRNAALNSYFGLVLSFNTPSQKEFLEIVKKLAKTANIQMSEHQLENKAVQWELRYLNKSGRTAEQFIEYLKANEKELNTDTFV